MTKYSYVATKLAKVKRDYVAKECFYVAIEFGQSQEFLCNDRVFSCCDKVWPWMGFLCRTRVFLRPNKVWPRQDILGHDREFDVTTKLSKLVLQPDEPSVAIESSRTWDSTVAT